MVVHEKWIIDTKYLYLDFEEMVLEILCGICQEFSI